MREEDDFMIMTVGVLSLLRPLVQRRGEQKTNKHSNRRKRERETDWMKGKDDFVIMTVGVLSFLRPLVLRSKEKNTNKNNKKERKNKERLIAE